MTPVDQYYRRAEELMSKGNLAQAILELRDALKLEPSNSSCHSLLGEIYLKQNQSTMAKVHINQALKAQSQRPQSA
uniref:Tetratricopeptide repeat protein n=1 Tax=Desertifilum tharense IPPAS B-1220 TaxID=1781255 RepID=A0ACD5GVI3_9CYAN